MLITVPWHACLATCALQLAAIEIGVSPQMHSYMPASLEP